MRTEPPSESTVVPPIADEEALLLGDTVTQETTPAPIPVEDAPAQRASTVQTENSVDPPKPSVDQEAAPTEQLTYAQIAERLGCPSEEAARAIVARRGLPRARGSDGKIRVTINFEEIHYQPRSTRSPSGDRPVAEPASARSPDPAAETEAAKPLPVDALTAETVSAPEQSEMPAPKSLEAAPASQHVSGQKASQSSTELPATVLPKNKGGSPGKWAWERLIPVLKKTKQGQPFQDMAALEEFCRDNVQPTDRKAERGNDPDPRSVKAAIIRHRLADYVTIDRPDADAQ
jgi:hypothetical protein